MKMMDIVTRRICVISKKCDDVVDNESEEGENGTFHGKWTWETEE